MKTIRLNNQLVPFGRLNALRALLAKSCPKPQPQPKISLYGLLIATKRLIYKLWDYCAVIL